MGDIGDYVHYRLENYLYFGTEKRNGRTWSSSKATLYNYAKQKKRISNKTKQLMTMPAKEEFEKALTSIYSTEDNSDYDPEYGNIVKESIENSFTKVNLDRLDAYLKRMPDLNDEEAEYAIEEGSKITYRWIRDTIEESNTFISTIYSRFAAIERAKKNLANKDQLTVNTILTEINEIHELFNDIIKEQRKKGVLKNREALDNRRHITLLKIGKNNGGEDKLVSLITRINNLIKNRDLFPTKSFKQAKGNLWEYTIAATAIKSAGLGADVLRQEIQNIANGNANTNKYIRGAAGSRMGYDFSSNFISGINVDRMLNKMNKSSTVYGKQGTNMILTLAPKQDKLDVMIEWKNTAVPISAKNYSTYEMKEKGINLVSVTPLLYLLQDEESNFVNDYFNIIATHPRSKENIPAGHIRQAHEAMKMTILYKAFTGKAWNRTNAEVFMVHNNTTNQIYIYDMKDLLKHAYQNEDYYKITANGVPLEKMKIGNRWKMSGYMERIENFLFGVHEQKMNASLTSSFAQGRFY